jgi:WD40 repeat protein
MSLTFVEVGSSSMQMGPLLTGNICDSIAVSADGKLIATGSGWAPFANEEKRGRLSLRRSDTLEEVAFADALGGRIWSIAFSNDGKLLATAEDDGFVRIWNFDSNR